MVMVTVQDVQGVTFDKGMRGYQVEQVDNFLDRVAAQLEENDKQIRELTSTNEELKSKLCELAKRLEGYRNDEDALKSALLNAQRMGENVIREAKQKSDAIVREASIRADDITRAAQARTSEQEIELQRIKGEVAQFKSNVLSLYKAHIESLSTLPDEEKAHEAPAQEPAAQPAEPAAPAAVQPEAPVQESAISQEADAAQPAQAAAPEAPAAAEPPAADAGDFWDKDESELASPEDSRAMKQDSFRGISFSD